MNLNDEEINIIDNYNKQRLLINVFSNLITKIKCDDNFLNQETKNDIIEFYNKYNIDNILNQKIFDKDLDSNNISVLFVKNENRIDSLKMDNIISNENLKLLSLYEEELRIFLKNKKEIQTKLSKYDKKSNKNKNDSDFLNKFKSYLDSLLTILNENIGLIVDIFHNFKFREVEREGKEAELFSEELEKFKEILKSIMGQITEEIINDQTYNKLENIKNKLESENNYINLQIKEYNNLLKEYEEKGEELTNLVREYKKICNLIEVKKLNNN